MIKEIFNPGKYTTKLSMALLLLRVVAGTFMLTHGTGKFLKLFSGDPVMFADPFGLGATASLALVVFSEVFCSIFLILGIATRMAAVPLMITMLVAAFIAHAADGFGKQELPLLYAAIYMVLAMCGAGIFSLDKLIYEKISSN